MDDTAVCERVRGIASARSAALAGTAAVSALEDGLRSISVVRAWLAAAEVDLAASLSQQSSFPEGAIAAAGRGSQNEAGRVLERARTLGAVPTLAGALNDGALTAAHVDAVTKAARGVKGEQRERLLRRADGLAGFAATSSVADFRRKLDEEVRSAQTGEGMARFER